MNLSEGTHFQTPHKPQTTATAATAKKQELDLFHPQQSCEAISCNAD